MSSTTPPRGSTPTAVPVDRAGTPFADRLAGRSFVSVSVTEHGAPRPLVAGTTIRLDFGPDSLAASAGCNVLSLPLVVDATRLVTGPASSTLIGCSAEREAQDEWLIAFLISSPEWSRIGTTLTLTSGGTRIELDEAGDPAALWDATYAATSVEETGIVPAPLVDGTTIRLTFAAPDQLSAVAGCNVLGFRVTVDGAQLIVDAASSTRMACTPDLGAQDAWLATFLIDDPAFVLDGDELTLTRGSTRIVLRREDRPAPPPWGRR